MGMDIRYRYRKLNNNRLYRRRHATTVRELPPGHGRRIASQAKHYTRNFPSAEVQHELVEVRSTFNVVITITGSIIVRIIIRNYNGANGPSQI